METVQSTKKLYQYADVRTFLKEYADTKKARNPSWSLGVWARSLGFKGTASLTRILNGDRNPGPEITDRLISYFGFSEREKTYFQNLVLLEKAKEDPGLQVLVMEKLQSLHPKKDFKLLDTSTFMAVANWYYYAIREMVRLKDFEEDADWIAQKLNFKVLPKQVKEAIKVMLDLGLLSRAESGKLIQSEGRIDWKSDVLSEASKRNHEQNLDNAKAAIRAVDIKEREFNSMCMTISMEKMERAKQLIREFRDRFTDLIEEEAGKGDATYQLQIQFFPFTKKGAKK